MRRWFVDFLAEVLAETLQRVLTAHVPYCDHGYIAIACEWCRIQRGL